VICEDIEFLSSEVADSYLIPFFKGEMELDHAISKNQQKEEK
jgi:hypothetical protein